MARNPHGTPIWYELIVDDPDAAQAFYEQVLGWTTRSAGMSDMDYRLFTAADGKEVGGMLKRLEGMGRPCWITYFGVDDVDVAVETTTANGGQVHMPPTTIPGVGRLSMVTDPQGHAFYVMRGEPDEESAAFQHYHGPGSAQPGHAVWNELTAEDQDAAMDFYGKVLNLRHEGGMPMGAWGEYKFVHVGDTCIGASMNAQPEWPRGWNTYFLTGDIDEALERVKAAGGSPVQGPDEIPGGDFSLISTDPEGVRFGLVGTRKR